MKRLRCIGLTLLCIGVILLIYSNLDVFMKAYSIMLGEPNYLIITADIFYDTTELQTLISHIQSKGFIVEVKTVTQIYQEFSPIETSPPLLKVSSINNMIPSVKKEPTFAFFIDEKGNYHCFGYYSSIDSKYIQHENSTVPREIILYFEYETGDDSYLQLNYDDNKTLTVDLRNLPRFYINWGRPFITTDGKIYFNETEAYPIWRYIKSRKTSVEYVLLVGDSKLIPGFPFRKMLTGLWTPLETLTDHLYAVFDEFNNKQLTPNISVGRLPVETVEELSVYVNKLVNFVPEQSYRSLIVKGYAGSDDSATQQLWEEHYNLVKNDVNNSLTDKLFEADEPTTSECIAEINHENNYVVFFAHGTSSSMLLAKNYYLKNEDFVQIEFNNYTLVFLLSCFTGNYKANDCIAEKFVLDSDSNTVFSIAPALPTGTQPGGIICRQFFSHIPSYHTVGETLKIAKLLNVYYDIFFYIYERLNYQLFGEPSANLYAEVSPPAEKYGWLELSFTVNGEFVDETATFNVEFPNDTVKTYVGNEVTITKCPVGEYYVECRYDDRVQNQTVYVNENQGSRIIFNFETEQQILGTLIVRSNIELTVTVEGKISITKQTPFTLSDIPLGTYTLRAYFNDELVDEKTVTLTETNNIQEVMFYVEVPSQYSSYIQLLYDYSPYILIGLALIIIVRG